MSKLLLIAPVLALLAIPASAQPTQEQRAACEQDYWRFCQQVGTEQDVVRRCLLRNKSRLNPTCRGAFSRKRR